jgi:hypothetical protein
MTCSTGGRLAGQVHYAGGHKTQRSFCMKKKLVFSAMTVCLLALGLVLAGCPNGSTGGGGNDDSANDKLYGKWGDIITLTFSSPNKVVTSVGNFTGTYAYDGTTLKVSGGAGNGTASMPATISGNVLTLGTVSGGEGTEAGEMWRVLVEQEKTYTKQ